MMNLLALVVGLLVAVPAVAEFQAPATPNPVNDYAHVLTRGGKERIAQAVVTLKEDVGAQVGVLIVESLDGSTIEDASMKVAMNWKLGSKDKDDGVLVFIAVKDRKMRVEVGRGIEGIITDYYAKQITMGMKPGLRAGNYDQAVLAAIDGISNRIKAHSQEITSKSGSTSTTTTTSDSNTGLNFFVGFLILFGLGGVIATYVTIQNKRREEERASRKLSKQPLTPEQRENARLMYKDVAKRAKTDPGFPKEEKKSRDDDDGFVSGVIVGSLLSSDNGHKSSSDDDDGGSFGGGFGSSDSGSSSSGSDFGGGGGDFGGGGSSDSF